MGDVLPLPVRACGSGVVVVEVTGELDIATAPGLSAVLGDVHVRSARPGLRVLLDLSRLDFCDMAGINAMAAAARRLDQRGAQLALVAPRRNFMRLLKAAMLSGYFEVLPGVPAAQAS